MAMCMTATEAQMTQKDKDLMQVQKMRKAAEMLSSREEGSWRILDFFK